MYLHLKYKGTGTHKELNVNFDTCRQCNACLEKITGVTYRQGAVQLSVMCSHCGSRHTLRISACRVDVLTGFLGTNNPAEPYKH